MNIRQKFITTLLLIGLLPMLVVGTIAYDTINSAQLRSTTDLLNSTAVKQEQKMTATLQEKQEEVVKLANQFDVQVQLRQYATSPTDANKQALAGILQAKKAAQPAIHTLYLLDTSKNLVASSVIGSGQVNLPDELRSSRSQATIYKDPADGFNKLFITTAVTINKQHAADLIGVFRADDLVAIVQDYTGLGDTGETVVTGKGNASLLPLRFDTEAALKTDISSLGANNLANGALKTTHDYRNKNVLLVARTVGSTDWKVIVKIDRNEAFIPVYALRDSLGMATAIASVVIVVVAILLTRFFTRPILQIGEVARHIGRGEFSTKLNIRRKDELGALARSVNAMGTSLSELVGGIETQRQRLQIVLDSTTEGIFAIDETGRVVLANKAVSAFLQTEPPQLVGKELRELFTWRVGTQTVALDYLSPGVRAYTNLEWKNPAGEKRYAKVIVASVMDSERRDTRSIVTIHDETSSRELEVMKADFVSMAAHELRTPLTAVRGYLEVALYKEDKHDFTEVMSYVRQALKSVAELGGLINNLLDVSRIERGTLTLAVEKVDLERCLNRLIQDVQFLASDKNITVAFEKSGDNAFVIGDELALREIFSNLVINAIKYNHEGGTVTVRLRRRGAMYEISVADTGIGIPAKALGHIFEKFYRVKHALEGGVGGTGLGLYIVRSIVERHRGTISVESKEGKGSTFTVKLPVYTDEAFKKQHPGGQDDLNIRRNRGWVTKNIAR